MDTELRTCTNCGESKPATTRYFYQHRRGQPLLRSKCKKCTSSGVKKRNRLEDIHTRYTVNDEGCWIYTHTLNKSGYGVFYYQQIGHLAHRVSYTLVKGEIPEGLVLDHLCRERSCINPDHLEPVTQSENARRGLTKPPHCKTCICEGAWQNS